jgi:hypothetical protein
MLLGLAVLLAVRPCVQLVATLDHAQSSACAFVYQREPDQHRVAGCWLVAGGMIPAEREAGWWLNCLDGEGIRLVTEDQHTLPAGSEVELRAVGKPLADLVGLGNGAPHHVDGRVDDDLASMFKLAMANHAPVLTCNQR